MSYVEIDPKPIEAIFGYEAPKWEREDGEHGAWRRMRRASIPADARAKWIRPNATETVTEETIEHFDGFEFTKITEITRSERLYTPTTVNFKLTEYTLDGRVLSKLRTPPRRYGIFVNRKLDVHLHYGDSTNPPQAIEGNWLNVKVELQPELNDIQFSEVISCGLGNIDDPRIFVESEEAAERITRSLTTLRRLQLMNV